MGKRKGKKSAKVGKGEGDKGTHSSSDNGKPSTDEERLVNLTENSDDLNSSELSVEIGQQTGLLSDGPPYAVQEKGPAMPPWLTSPVVRMGQRIASLPEGFDMDASFSSNRFANIDAPSVVTDMDDDIHHRTGRQNDDVNSATSAEKGALDEELSNQGIGLFVDIDTDEASLGAFSDLSTSNQSYILDLAMQKESRDKHLKEEALEEALTLFKEARKAGHGTEAFFLIIVAEVQKKLEESKAELFRLQDERLNQALDEELQRQEEKNNLSGSSLRSGKGGRQERVSVYIEKEKSRRSVDPTTMASVAAAAAEATDDIISLGEYDWGDVDESRESQVVKSKKKTKSKQSKTTKKDKALKSEKPKTKKKKVKSLDDSTPTLSDEPIPQSAENEMKEASHDESNSAQETVEKTSKPSGSKSQSKKPKKKKNKSKESKKAKTTPEGDEEKPASTKSTHQTTKSKDDGSETAETATCIDSARHLTRDDHRDETSPTETQDLDGSANVIREHDGESAGDFDRKLNLNARGGDPSITKKDAAGLKQPASASKGPQRTMSNLLSSVFRRNAQGTGGSQTSKRVGLFKKKKQKGMDDDPSSQPLPIPGSQLQ